MNTAPRPCPYSDLAEDLATGYRDRGRAAKGMLPAEQSLAARESPAAANDAAKVFPAGFRRPPADPARQVLPPGFHRSPAHPAGRLLCERFAGPSAKLLDHSSRSSTQEPPSRDAEIADATQVATAQLNARARPWIWGRPQPKPRTYRRRFIYAL